MSVVIYVTHSGISKQNLERVFSREDKSVKRWVYQKCVSVLHLVFVCMFFQFEILLTLRAWISAF